MIINLESYYSCIILMSCLANTSIRRVVPMNIATTSISINNGVIPASPFSFYRGLYTIVEVNITFNPTLITTRNYSFRLAFSGGNGENQNDPKSLVSLATSPIETSRCKTLSSPPTVGNPLTVTSVYTGLNSTNPSQNQVTSSVFTINTNFNGIIPIIFTFYRYQTQSPTISCTSLGSTISATMLVTCYQGGDSTSTIDKNVTVFVPVINLSQYINYSYSFENIIEINRYDSSVGETVYSFRATFTLLNTNSIGIISTNYVLNSAIEIWTGNYMVAPRLLNVVYNSTNNSYVITTNPTNDYANVYTTVYSISFNTPPALPTITILNDAYISSTQTVTVNAYYGYNNYKILIQ